MSTIALFGGSGRTGERVLERLLKKGHRVTLLTRQSLGSNEEIDEILGDATDRDAVFETVRSADVVISALGTDKQNVLSTFTPLVIEAMKQFNVTRIITVGTAGILQAHDSDNYRFETKESKRTMTTAAEDHARAYELLRDSGLAFTVICPTQLIDEQSTGEIIVSKEVLGTKHSGPISRDDVADLVMACLTDDDYVGHRVGITTES
ncbi:Putative oxidoreductase [Exiguobacterium sp. 8H]|uniref:NAD(P)-dependent oxidoreductase n=1 Tax=unclassified Exiguobacterium TaxID=2644629 RepID=UPI0012F24EA1|nr:MULTISPECIES: NAD(P)H-binding protein [unclassified Exiguobacterium]VXB20052.1 Putative oxidoreductase [Exiguobacterium sp. 8H]VXB20868.1 putative oxidoreductase [Exiguobacterium sp. 8A]